MGAKKAFDPGPKASGEPPRVSAVDRVVDQLRDFIGRQGLAVGDQLPTERELSDRFGASRNTVREALRVVKTYGFIETQTKTGAVISDRSHESVRELFAFQLTLSPASFQDVQGFRKIVEVGMGEQLMQTAGEADWDRVDTINRSILDARSAREASECDYAFHFALIELVGNRTLTETYRLLRPVICHVMTLGKTSIEVLAQTCSAHDEILAALRARDRIAFAYLMSRHLEFARRFLDPARETASPDLALVSGPPAGDIAG